MHTTKRDTTHTNSDFLKITNNPALICYLPELLPFAPTAELCASPRDNRTTFGILEQSQTFFTSFWLGLCLLLVLTDLCLVCLPSWVGSLILAGSKLVEGNGSELSSWLQRKQVRHFCVVFHDIIASWKIASVLHARNWCRQQTTINLIWCHWPWPGSCQWWYLLTVNFTPWHRLDRQRERASELKAFN